MSIPASNSSATNATSRSQSQNRAQMRAIRNTVLSIVTTLFVAWLATIYLRPLYYSLNLSLGQASTEADQPQYPSTIQKFTFEGQPLEIYNVPTENGMKQLALIEKSRSESVFIDPTTKQRITWQGSYRSLKRVFNLNPQWPNYPEAAKQLDFMLYFRNTMIVSILATIGSVLSGILVAYGIARFRSPYLPTIMGVLQTTLILPREVLLVPTYIMFYKIGWVGTWLPLVVPLFFGSSFSIFLLRQFFLAIPRDLDEAAMLDGANPLQILWKIIVPLAGPAIISVAIAQFIFTWNDVINPVLYLAGHDELQMISPALNRFSSAYGQANPHLTAAAGMLASALPVALFLLAQRPYFRAMMMPGLDK
jgi:multiple sugar transport system permease protein